MDFFGCGFGGTELSVDVDTIECNHQENKCKGDLKIGRIQNITKPLKSGGEVTLNKGLNLIKLHH